MHDVRGEQNVKTSTIVATWIELDQAFMESHPPRSVHHEAWLCVNYCELRKSDSGINHLRRSTRVESLEADTAEELQAKIGEYVLREDVRLLARGLASNDCEKLPRRVSNPSADVIEGIDSIYHLEPEPVENKT